MRIGKDTSLTSYTQSELFELANDVLNNKLSLNDVKKLLGDNDYKLWKKNYYDVVIKGRDMTKSIEVAIFKCYQSLYNIRDINNNIVRIINYNVNRIKKLQEELKSYTSKVGEMMDKRKIASMFDREGRIRSDTILGKIKDCQNRLNKAYYIDKDTLNLINDLRLLKSIEIANFKALQQEVNDYNYLLLLNIL